MRLGHCTLLTTYYLPTLLAAYCFLPTNCLLPTTHQGHCTLVSTVQQQQILMLHCMISAYSLSALSLDGSRASEPQLIASGMLLSCAIVE